MIQIYLYLGKKQNLIVQKINKNIYNFRERNEMKSNL